MSIDDRLPRADAIEPGSDRSFGLIVGGILVALGAYQALQGSRLYLGVIGVGALLALLGLVAPRVLHGLNCAWTRLGVLLGRFVTPVVMLLVYAVSVVPIGLAMRAAGKDLLRLERRPKTPSYWIERRPPGPPPESLRDQF